MKIIQNKIHILPEFIANQIAAGEVVQRPESVVKELVENSIDSGANSIAVFIKGAGKQLIHIVDNGDGMTKDDLTLSCKRHATSKIISTEDLEEIYTYGFRGEALASICSIAGIEIRTRQQNDEHGWKIISEPMKDEIIEPCNSDFGTQVFVRNLFFNVPARRKFLRTDLTEFRYISDTMLKFAISKPDIRFTFYDNDTLIFDLKPTLLENRIPELFGSNTIDSLLKVDYESEFFKVKGFIGLPILAKQSRSGQYFFLNGRSIVNKSLSHAVFSAYEHLIEHRANPFFILNIEVNPKQYDVNVHPQKHEVKFEDERHVYNIIHKAVIDALSKHNLAPEIRVKNFDSQTPFEKLEFTGANKNSDLLLVNKLTGEIVSQQPQFQHNISNPYSQSYNQNWQQNRNFSNQRPNQVELSAFDVLFSKDENHSDLQANTYTQADGNQKQFADVWQLHNKYIFAATEDGFIMIDQHAAHERILYERAIKAMNHDYAYSQQLLFPVTFKLNYPEFILLNEINDEIDALGFVIKILDNSIIELSGIPSDIPTGFEENALKEILEQYIEEQKIRHTDKRDYLAASFACKAAIKTGHIMSKEEITQLLKDLFTCQTPFCCPHGRPIILEFPLTELDKRFGRT